MTVSVVIPNWNGAELIATALDSLAAQTVAPLETIVVDNGSSDGSAALIRARWPTVQVIELARNLGFAAAVNIGVDAAAGDYVALVNNDVELASGWLAALNDVCLADPSIASAVGKLLRFEDRRTLEECGSSWAWEGTICHRGEGAIDAGQFERLDDVFSVCAAAALYSRAALSTVGPFDDAFFAYFEDVDWGFRARLAGYRAVYVPAAEAFHRRQATSARTPSLDLLKLHTRNSWLVILKCYPLSALARHAPAIAIRQLRLLVYAVRHGWFRSYRQAVRELISLLPHVVRARVAIRRVGRPGPVRFPALPLRH